MKMLKRFVIAMAVITLIQAAPVPAFAEGTPMFDGGLIVAPLLFSAMSAEDSTSHMGVRVATWGFELAHLVHGYEDDPVIATIAGYNLYPYEGSTGGLYVGLEVQAPQLHFFANEKTLLNGTHEVSVGAEAWKFRLLMTRVFRNWKKEEARISAQIILR